MSEPDQGVARPLLCVLPARGVILLPAAVLSESEFGLRAKASCRVCCCGCGVLRRGMVRGALLLRTLKRGARGVLWLLPVLLRCGVEEREVTGVATDDVLAEPLREALDEPRLAACQNRTQAVRRLFAVSMHLSKVSMDQEIQARAAPHAANPPM